MRAQVIDQRVEVLDTLAELLAVAGAQEERAAPGLERVGRVALRRQRLVHLDDAAQVEHVRQPLELRQGQLHRRVDHPMALGIELERALELFEGLRIHRTKVTACLRSAQRLPPDGTKRRKKKAGVLCKTPFLFPGAPAGRPAATFLVSMNRSRLA